MADNLLVGSIAGAVGLLGGAVLGRATAQEQDIPVFIGNDWEKAESMLYSQGLNPSRYSTPVFGEGMPFVTPAIMLSVPASESDKAMKLLVDWKAGRPLPPSVRSMLI